MIFIPKRLILISRFATIKDIRMFLIDYYYHYAQNSSEEQPYLERKTENQSIIFK